MTAQSSKLPPLFSPTSRIRSFLLKTTDHRRHTASRASSSIRNKKQQATTENEFLKKIIYRAEREKKRGNPSEKRNVHLSREEQSFSIVVKRVRSFDPRPGCKNCGVSAPRKWLRSRIIGQSGNCASTGYDAFFRAYRASHHHRTCQ